MLREPKKKAGADATALLRPLDIAVERLRRVTAQLLGEFVFDLELPSLERSDQQVVVAQMSHLHLDLAIKFLMPPLKRGDVAFSRHDNSFPAFWTTQSSQKIHD